MQTRRQAGQKTGRQTFRKINIRRNKQTGGKTARQTDRKWNIHKYRQTRKQLDRQTDGQTVRQTGLLGCIFMKTISTKQTM